MDSGTDRNPERPAVDAYWRRRVIALTGAVATVGLIAWACGSGGGDDKKQPVRNAAAVASPSSGPVPSAMPTVTVTATKSVTVSPSAQKKDGDACEPADLVVGMTPTKDSYSGGEQPQLQMTVVNTGTRACTFGVGPKELEVRITSGADRVWSSAHCARGSGSSIQMLKRGIPHIFAVTWDRKRSSDGCSGGRAAVRPGTYVAALNAGKLKVKKQVFRLR